MTNQYNPSRWRCIVINFSISWWLHNWLLLLLLRLLILFGKMNNTNKKPIQDKYEINWSRQTMNECTCWWFNVLFGSCVAVIKPFERKNASERSDTITWPKKPLLTTMTPYRLKLFKKKEWGLIIHWIIRDLFTLNEKSWEANGLCRSLCRMISYE